MKPTCSLKNKKPRIVEKIILVYPIKIIELAFSFLYDSTLKYCPISAVVVRSKSEKKLSSISNEIPLKKIKRTRTEDIKE